MVEDALQLKERILAYIVKNTHSDRDKIHAHSMLFKEGIFDSMGFVLLIDYLEENFNIKTNDEDLIEENFESINAIVQYIQRKKTDLKILK